MANMTFLQVKKINLKQPKTNLAEIVEKKFPAVS